MRTKGEPRLEILPACTRVGRPFSILLINPPSEAVEVHSDYPGRERFEMSAKASRLRILRASLPEGVESQAYTFRLSTSGAGSCVLTVVCDPHEVIWRIVRTEGLRQANPMPTVTLPPHVIQWYNNWLAAQVPGVAVSEKWLERIRIANGGSFPVVLNEVQRQVRIWAALHQTWTQQRRYHAAARRAAGDRRYICTNDIVQEANLRSLERAYRVTLPRSGRLDRWVGKIVTRLVEDAYRDRGDPAIPPNHEPPDPGWGDSDDPLWYMATLRLWQAWQNLNQASPGAAPAPVLFAEAQRELRDGLRLEGEDDAIDQFLCSLESRVPTTSSEDLELAIVLFGQRQHRTILACPPITKPQLLQRATRLEQVMAAILEHHLRNRALPDDLREVNQTLVEVIACCQREAIASERLPETVGRLDQGELFRRFMWAFRPLRIGAWLWEFLDRPNLSQAEQAVRRLLPRFDQATMNMPAGVSGRLVQQARRLVRMRPNPSEQGTARRLLVIWMILGTTTTGVGSLSIQRRATALSVAWVARPHERDHLRPEVDRLYRDVT